jgi:transcription factor S
MTLEFNTDGSIKIPKPGSKKHKTSEKIEKKEIVAVIKEDESNTFPVVQIKCPECKHKKSYFWTQQTRAADENETKFYKCVKCKHTWRVYK